MVRHLEPFAFFDADALGERVEFIHLAELIAEDGADGLGAAADEILRQSFEEKPAVIVIDSSKALHDVVEPEQFRRAIYDLASKVAYSDAVADPRRRVLRGGDAHRSRSSRSPTASSSSRTRRTGRSTAAGCAS